MLSLANPAGRLLTIRAAPPITLDAFSRFTNALHGLEQKLPLGQMYAVDFSALRILPGALLQAVRDVMGGHASSVLRSAILVGPDHGVLRLQMERLIGEGPSDRRRIFDELAPLALWLGDVLHGDEARALRQFLVEDGQRPAAR